ncbi:hypothetical protein KGO95_00100 [Patescibacteria group bacterium]|nr:hypothetical protein [Patescibacteria group bacterium]
MSPLRSWARIMIRACPKKPIDPCDRRRRISRWTAWTTSCFISLSIDGAYFTLDKALPEYKAAWAILFLTVGFLMYWVFFKRFWGVLRYKKRIKTRR